MENRPVGRKKNVTEGGSGVHKRGEGLGTGPVGNSSGYSSGSGPSENGGGMKRSGKGINPLFMIIVLLFYFNNAYALTSLSDKAFFFKISFISVRLSTTV